VLAKMDIVSTIDLAQVNTALLGFEDGGLLDHLGQLAMTCAPLHCRAVQILD
jgi:hypothetical protein